MGAARAVRVTTHTPTSDANAKTTFQCRRKRAPAGSFTREATVCAARASRWCYGARLEGRMPRTSTSTPRLRARPLGTPLHVVLVEPEIPPNTGNIARLCAATASPLHLVGTLGFRIDEHSVRRAGVDYWHLVDVRRHSDFEHFLHAFSRESPGGKLHLFSAIATKSYLD